MRYGRYKGKPQVKYEIIIEMKLVNLNISLRIDNALQVAKYIYEGDADIVCLQEVSRHLSSSVKKKYQSKADLDKALGKKYPYSFFGPLWVSDGIRVKGKKVADFGGFIEQGSYILSKFPFACGMHEFYYRGFSLTQDDTDWQQEDHGRALQKVVIKYGEKRFQVGNVHGIWTSDKKGDERTISQCKFIVDSFRKLKLPTILAGDFNLLPQSESIKIIDKTYENLIDRYQIRSTRPDFEDGVDKGGNIVDYIFVNSRINVKGLEVPPLSLSDHFPLILEFDV